MHRGPDAVPVAEELARRIGADDRYTQGLCVIRVPERAAAVNVNGPYQLILGLDAVHGQRGRIVGALHPDATALDFRADNRDVARLGRQCPGVFEREEDLPARAFPTGLLRRTAAPDDAHVAAEFFENVLVALRWKPSPVAERITTEITPHRIPNIVRKLRSLFARRFITTCDRTSRMTNPGGRPWCQPPHH